MKRSLLLLPLLAAVVGLALWLSGGSSSGGAAATPARPGQPAPATPGPVAPAELEPAPVGDRPGPSAELSAAAAEESGERQAAATREVRLGVAEGDDPLQQARAWLLEGGARVDPTPGEVLEAGRSVPVEADDRVRLEGAGGDDLLVGVDGLGRWGMGRLDALEAAGGLLVLERRLDLRVRVRDAAGAPRVDEHVAIEQGTWRQALAEGRTDSAGELRLRSELVPAGDWSKVQRVVLAGAWSPPVEQALAPSAPPPAPIELRTPAGAALEVTVLEGDGTALDGAAVTALPVEVFDAAYSTVSPGKGPGEHAETVGGRARLERITPGSDLVVIAHHPDGSGRVDGRTVAPEAGATAGYTLAFDPTDVVWAGRLVGSRAVHGYWEYALLDPGSDRWSTERRLRPDEKGRFRIRFEGEHMSSAVEGAMVLLAQEERIVHSLPVRGRTTPGVHDLGELPVETGTLVAGVVVDLAGAPVGDIYLTLEVRVPGQGGWQHVPTGGWIRVRADGTFEVEGRGSDLLEWRFRPEDSGGELVEPASFVPGTTDLRLVLDRGRVLEGKVLLPESVSSLEYPPRYLRLLAQESGERPRTHYVQLRPDGSFQLPAMKGESFDLAVRTTWHDRPLRELRGLPTAMPAGDPRLEIDLRETLRPVRLAVVDDDELPVREAYAYPREEGPPAWKNQQDGELVLLFDRPAMDLVVGAAGYLEQEVPAVRSDRQVVLAHAPSVVLVCKDLPELEAHQRLRPILAAEGQEPSTEFSDDGAFSAEGVAVVRPPRAGRYTVHLQVEVVREGSRTAGLLSLEDPQAIVVLGVGPEERFEVGFDPEQVLERLESMNF